MDTSPIAEIKALVAENRTSDALSRLLELSRGNKQVHDAISSCQASSAT